MSFAGGRRLLALTTSANPALFVDRLNTLRTWGLQLLNLLLLTGFFFPVGFVEEVVRLDLGRNLTISALRDIDFFPHRPNC
jgi:hypothetical protein